MDLFFWINIENENFFVVEDFVCVNFVLVVDIFLGLVLNFFCFLFPITLVFFFEKKKIVNYIINPNNILFNRKNVLCKVPTKHNFIQYNHFLPKVLIFYQTHYFQQNAL